jgi:hypothetical protein
LFGAERILIKDIIAACFLVYVSILFNLILVKLQVNGLNKFLNETSFVYDVANKVLSFQRYFFLIGPAIGAFFFLLGRVIWR